MCDLKTIGAYTELISVGPGLIQILLSIPQKRETI